MTTETNNPLGPLAPLVGTWEGDKGADLAPSDTRGLARSKYREVMSFEPTGRVDNHEQVLFGLRYSTKAWRLGADEPFHEELGYWLWDAQNRQVLRCFIVPRGVTVIAGGTAEPDARTFSLAAKVGSETYGICSNKFLDEEFKTVAYDLKIEIVDGSTFRYEEDTQLRMKGKTEIFHHTDENTMRRR